MVAEPFIFFSQGRKLQGTLNRPEARQAPAAVLCHGFGSYDDDLGAFVRLAQKLSQTGIPSLHFGEPVRRALWPSYFHRRFPQ